MPIFLPLYIARKHSTARPLLLLFIPEIYSEMLEIKFELDLVHGMCIYMVCVYLHLKYVQGSVKVTSFDTRHTLGLDFTSYLVLHITMF